MPKVLPTLQKRRAPLAASRAQRTALAQVPLERSFEEALESAGAPPGGAPGGEYAGGFSFENLGDLGGLGDLFGSIFEGRGRRGRAQPGPRRGENVEYAVEIPFHTAVRGGKLSITVPVTETCPTCGGNGAKPGTPLVQCPECNGAGTVVFGQGGFAVTRPCPMCGGRGTIPREACPTCNGSGKVRRERQIQVNVPAGVDNGSKLRLSGQGQAGNAGGPPGDLILTFRVQADRFFTREGMDLACTVPINVAQATLGSRIRVRTVDGKVDLRIPEGTQSGTRFRIRGQGVEKAGQRGDQYVQVKVTVPERLDEREESLMREFASAAELRY